MNLDERQREDLKKTSDVYESMTSSSGSRMSGVIVFPIVTVALLLHSLKLFLLVAVIAISLAFTYAFYTAEMKRASAATAVLLIGCVIYLFNWL